MKVKSEINSSDYPIGVLVARFQVHNLHDGHIDLIESVCKNHSKVIIFLGIPVIQNTENDPLDFAMRRSMIQEKYPKIVVLPLKDQRSDEKWSADLDDGIKVPFGDMPALLYGSRDSFIPYYKGKYSTIELITDTFYSGTEVRKQVSREILSSSDFRAGVIHATYAQRPVTYPTVDIVAINERGQILMAKKPNEKLWRFVGGFVDRTDYSWEMAAKREFMEETGGCEIGDLTYIASEQINDWRYRKSKSGIMTTLFLGKFLWGSIKPSDDISQLSWIYPNDLDPETQIMEEHKILFIKLINFLNKK